MNPALFALPFLANLLFPYKDKNYESGKIDIHCMKCHKNYSIKAIGAFPQLICWCGKGLIYKSKSKIRKLK
jgi:hypothetical protein